MHCSWSQKQYWRNVKTCKKPPLHQVTQRGFAVFIVKLKLWVRSATYVRQRETQQRVLTPISFWTGVLCLNWRGREAPRLYSLSSFILHVWIKESVCFGLLVPSIYENAMWVLLTQESDCPKHKSCEPRIPFPWCAHHAIGIDGSSEQRIGVQTHGQKPPLSQFKNLPEEIHLSHLTILNCSRTSWRSPLRRQHKRCTSASHQGATPTAKIHHLASRPAQLSHTGWCLSIDWISLNLPPNC